MRGVYSYMLNVDPTKRDDIKKISKNLIEAAITPTQDFENSPKGFPDKENVMHESPASDWASNDLATGKGVFMRLVTRIALSWNYFDDEAFKTKFKTFVNTTAESAWCSRDRDNKGTIKANWNPDFDPEEKEFVPPKQWNSVGLWPQVYQTNGLDALNAAWQIK